LTSAPQLSDCTDLGRGGEKRGEKRSGNERRERIREKEERRRVGGLFFFSLFPPILRILQQDRRVSVSTSAEDIRPVYFCFSSPLLLSFSRVEALSAG